MASQDRAFFFDEMKQKLLQTDRGLKYKSFLVLFFKKGLLGLDESKSRQIGVNGSN